jgi:biotin carboxyl carrier protein
MTEVKAETDCAINQLYFKDGDTVGSGDEIMQLEIMKMMIPVNAPKGGMIKYKVSPTQMVYAGTVLAEIV